MINIPEYIDWYSYSTETGKWEKGDPVKTSVRDKKIAIPLKSVNFSTAHLVYQQIMQKSTQIEGAVIPSNISFMFNVDEWYWSSRIEGRRSDYDFKTDKEGKEIKFERLYTKQERLW